MPDHGDRQPMPPRQELEQFKDFVRREGLRMTAERLELFGEIFAQHGHIDADELLAALKRRGSTISRATVYRNLDLMVRCGLVRRYQLGERRQRFEHLHQGQEHDHLVCARCGRMVEFKSAAIASMLSEIARAHGFEPSRHNLQIAGLCRDCAVKERMARESGAPQRTARA
jgi:Fur family transcriptional regulator, ferric uptake regulator